MYVHIDGQKLFFDVVCSPLYSTRPPSDPHQAARTIANPEVARHFLQPGAELHRMDVRAALGAVTCPLLVIAGRDDPHHARARRIGALPGAWKHCGSPQP